MTDHEPYTIPIAPQWASRMRLWAAINRYTEACGGRTDVTTMSGARVGAVLDVEHEIEELVTVVVEAASERREEG